MSALPRPLLARVRGRGRATQPDPDGMRRVDRLVEQAALVMVPSGLVLIILGWFGASRTPYTFEQIPYLISGGLFGVALTVSGGLLYVGGWVARAARMGRPATIAEGDERGAAAPVHRAAADRWVRTPSGTMFHRPSCSIVQGRDDVVALQAAQVASLRPCGMCEPTAG